MGCLPITAPYKGEFGFSTSNDTETAFLRRQLRIRTLLAPGPRLIEDSELTNRLRLPLFTIVTRTRLT